MRAPVAGSSTDLQRCHVVATSGNVDGDGRVERAAAVCEGGAVVPRLRSCPTNTPERGRVGVRFEHPWNERVLLCSTTSTERRAGRAGCACAAIIARRPEVLGTGVVAVSGVLLIIYSSSGVLYTSCVPVGREERGAEPKCERVGLLQWSLTVALSQVVKVKAEPSALSPRLPFGSGLQHPISSSVKINCFGWCSPQGSDHSKRAFDISWVRRTCRSPRSPRFVIVPSAFAVPFAGGKGSRSVEKKWSNRTTTTTTGAYLQAPN